MPDGADPVETASKLDILGSFGLMSKRHPLAAALCRLLQGGDNGASRQVVEIMASMLDGKAFRLGLQLSELQRVEISQSVLAWSRHGTCRKCNGLGYLMIEGAPSLSDHQCPACKGTGKIPFDDYFSHAHRNIANWLLSEIEREISKAGPAAVAALAPRLDL